MRSMKKLLQKAMVYTLTAAMLVGTPMTASAAGLVDLYSISDGTGTWDGHDTGSGTGTVTNTDTNSGALIGENDAKIIGITLDAQTLNLEKGDKAPLKATVILDGEITDADGNVITDDVIAEMSAKVKWEVLYLNADGEKITNQGDPAAKVGLELPKNWEDRSTVQLNAKQGTEKGKEVTVRATIDAAYYYQKNTEGNQNTEVLAWDDSRADIKYTAEAKVSVKEYSKRLSFVGAPTTTYVKHTLDLNEYLVRDPKTANDTITWTSTNTKVAKVSAAGVVTFVKVNYDGEDYTSAGACQIIAVGEKGAKAVYDVTVEQGTAASKVEIVPAESSSDAKKALFASNNKKLNLDVKNDETSWADVEVNLYAKVEVAVQADGKTPATSESDAKKSGDKFVTKKLDIKDGATYLAPSKDKTSVEEKTVAITDNIAWTSSKKTIADVDNNPGGKDGTGIFAVGLGSAKITAKASSGKSANITVTVKATLNSLEIGGIDKDDTLYSGQTVQLTAVRDPEINKDAVKWSIKKNGNKANPNATINSKGVLTIKPKLDTTKPDYNDEVTIVLETKATKKNENNVKVPVCRAEEVTIKVAQSNLNSISVYDDEAKRVIATAAYNASKRKIVVNDGLKGAANTTNISVPKGKNYTISAAAVEANAPAVETLAVKTSNAKIATVAYHNNGNACIKAVSKGTATVTVSGIREGKAFKTTFKVAVKQPATSLTMNKPSVVLKATGKKQSVSFSVKQNKNAKEAISWDITGTKSEGISITNKGKVTLNANSYDAGDEFTVTAKAAESGVTAKATIKIITTSTAVTICKDSNPDTTYSYFKKKSNGAKGSEVKNATVLDLGESITLDTRVNVGTKTAKDWYLPGENRNNKVASDVTYTASKKGIVQIIGDTVYRVGKGSVKITVKTADGKSYKLTIDDAEKAYVE